MKKEDGKELVDHCEYTRLQAQIISGLCANPRVICDFEFDDDVEGASQWIINTSEIILEKLINN